MRIGLISCTKSKTPYSAPARELYQPSALFRGALSYLEGRADHVYVISAKYGLLPLDQVAAPYDQTLKDATPAYRREWARQVLAALQSRHGELRGTTFEFHAGEAYRTDLQPLLEAAGAICTSPVAGLPIGERLHFYASEGASKAEGHRRRALRRVVHTGRATPASLAGQGWHAFPVEPAEVELKKARRELVVPADDPVRRLGKHGVYLYFDGDRCLYVGKASDRTLVGRALDYLYEEGGRPDVYRVIRENATQLLIRGAADPAAARRLELAQIVALEPVLNEGFIYATPVERHQYRLGGEPQALPRPVTGLKIHVGVWLAAALLHDEGQTTFSGARLAEEVERRFGDTRSGVQTHIAAHCVANAPKNTTVEYSYLVRADVGEYRLYRRGDPLHPSRSGSRTAPDQADVPEQYWEVWRRWGPRGGPAG